MKHKLVWALEHWYLLIVAAAMVMVILSLAGVKPAPDPERFYDGRPYTGEGIAWQETPDSSCFAYVGYDDEYEVLALVFRSNEQRAYLYREFLYDDYRAFMAADSLGGYYNENIKGKYPGERIDDAEGWFAP